MPETGSIAPSAGPFAVLGDQPAALGEDRLGFERFAASLARRLLTSVAHTPFTVGVLGDWGQGKTTVMRMLQARLEAEGCPTIWLEPWKYNDREGVWKGLALTLVREIKARDSLVREIRRKQGALEKFFGGFLWSRLIGDKWGEKLVEAATTEPWSAASLHEMESTLDDLFRLASPADHGHPIVLFVDDLDRCLPEAARSVLEAVKLVLARKGLITVLGIAEGELARAVHAAYAESMKGTIAELDPEWGRKYIRKIIQMPFPVPQISEGSFDAYVGHCLRASGVASLLGDRTEWHAIVRETCGANLREVKRFLNRFIAEMDKAAANLDALKDEGRAGVIDVTANPARVAFVLLLAWRFREFYRHVRTGARRDLLYRYQLAFTSDLPDEEAAEKLLDPGQEFHLDDALAEFFRRCLRGADGVAPLVPEFRDWRDLLPYLQFGLLPEAKAREGAIAGDTGPVEGKKAASRAPAAETGPKTQEAAVGELGGLRETQAMSQAGLDASSGMVESGDGPPEGGPAPDEPEAAAPVPPTPGTDALAAAEEGQSLLASGRYEEAAHKLRRSIRRAQKADDQVGQAMLLWLLAAALRAQDVTDEAESMLMQAMKISERIGDRSGVFESVVMVAQVYSSQGDYETAASAAKESVSIARNLNDPLALSRGLDEWATALEVLGKFSEAQQHREEILELAETLGQPTLKGDALLRLGKNLFHQGKFEAAQEDLRQALEVARKIGHRRLEASALTGLDEIETLEKSEAP